MINKYKTQITEMQYDSADELKTNVDEWLKLGDSKSKYNSYSNNNYIYIFHRLKDPSARYVYNLMPDNESQREIFKNSVYETFKRDNVFEDLPFKRMREVEFSFHEGTEDLVSFTQNPEFFNYINEIIDNVCEPHFATPYLAVLHIDTEEGPHMHLLYMTHEPSVVLDDYFTYLMNKEID